MIKLSDYIAKRLKEVYGVKRVYLVPGGGAMHLNDSFGRYIPYICNHHEQGCAFSAEGQARYSNELAVVNTTSGPGALNAVTGVFGQWTDSVPVLYISGQIKRATLMATYPNLPIRQIGDQEVDIISIVKPITKFAVCVVEPKKIKYYLDKAIYEATHGRRGPVWIDIPLDVQSTMIDENELEKFTPPIEPKYDLQLMDVKKAMQKAKRPVVVAGYGVRISGMINKVREFVSTHKIPILTTFNGADLFEDDFPYHFGHIGTIGQRSANFILQNSDCVLFLGTRNNIRQVSYNWESYADRAYKIVVDIDSAELKKPTVKPDLPILADLSAFVPALQQIGKGDLPEHEEWLDYCHRMKDAYCFANTPEYQQTSATEINPYYFIRKLSEEFAENEIVVTGNGSACVIPFQTGAIKKGMRMFWNSGNATMGFDLPASIGACLAADKKRVICLAGDGSIMMNLQELQTIKNYNLPIKIFVINNDGYISMKQTQGNFFNGRLTAADSSSGVVCPNFAKLAAGFDIPGFCVDKPEDITATIHQVLATDGPVICEVKVAKKYIFAPKLSSRKLEDGTLVSSRLEDMFPFLDRCEFNENMLKD